MIRLINEKPTKENLLKYSEVSIAFYKTSQFEISLIEGGLGGLCMTEKPLAPAWKDYDFPDNAPHKLVDAFDLSQWQIIAAYDGEKRIGGALIAFNTPGIHMLEGKSDLAVIWDIRVAKTHRGMGVGSQLVEACKKWARDRECHTLKVETQNNNVSACRFYASMGGTLSNLNMNYYADFPDEVQLIWSMAL